MKLLDLFCCAGGCAMGYWRAGFHDITGVDHKFQKNYPFDFHQADVFEWCETHDLSQYDLIHASPPCQRYTRCTPPEHRDKHPDDIARTRKLIKKGNYVMENVPDARALLNDPIMLCGTMFGMNLWRHRYFECKPLLTFPPADCNHSRNPVMITGTSRRYIDGVRVGEHSAEECRQESGLFWMTRKEMDEAIPPAYTEWIGKQLMGVI